MTSADAPVSLAQAQQAYFGPAIFASQVAASVLT